MIETLVGIGTRQEFQIFFFLLKIGNKMNINVLSIYKSLITFYRIPLIFVEKKRTFVMFSILLRKHTNHLDICNLFVEIYI